MAGLRLLLMDEPLAALDQARKQEILPYMERLHDELEIPVIYVSHSPDEVARLADQIFLMEDGRAVAQGPLTETLARVDLPLRRWRRDLGPRRWRCLADTRQVNRHPSPAVCRAGREWFRGRIRANSAGL
jgi:ABC-type glutathione transport system ATPase component